jgi:molybdopterin synthase sulfur carrier subunit
VKILYFAWVRERIGKTDEELDLPPEIATIADLIRWLADRGEEYSYAFENPKVIRAAIDRVHAQPATRIGTAREIAFFPPMTGG